MSELGVISGAVPKALIEEPTEADTDSEEE
jgi:hypothetical protein